MLGNHGRGLTKALFTRPALALGRLGVTPNMLTVTGTVLSVTAAVTLLPRGHFVVGPLVLLVVLVADSFDGILARATGKSSVFGAFLDSTMDRLADGAVLGSLAAWAALSMPVGALRTVTVAAALVAVVMAATVPYARARAEAIGAAASVGIAAHLHQHIVPRWKGDANFMPIIGRTKPVPQLLGQQRDMLAAAWPSGTGQNGD